MSMDSISNGGHTLEINEETMKTFIIEFSDGVTSENMTFEELKEVCEGIIDDNTDFGVKVTLRDPKYENVAVYGLIVEYYADDGSQYDEIDEESVWILVNEGSIYRRQYTPAGKVLADLNLFPEIRVWSQWG